MAAEAGGPPPARVALVTGAGRGIGRQLALGLGAAGLDVALLGRRPEPLAALAGELAAIGVRAEAVVADVTVWAQVAGAVAAAEAALGPLDLLVNNAGVIDPEEVPVWQADPQAWRDVVETDLLGPFHCVRAAVPGMVARGGGRVVDLSSGAGADDRAVYSAYCAAKAGLMRIGGNLDLAGARHGIRSFEVAPGVVRTEMTGSMAMHRGRSQWTDPQATLDLVLAIARGELDAWSGRFLRAGLDTPAALAAAAAAGAPGPAGRRLGVLPYGPHDPMPH